MKKQLLITLIVLCMAFTLLPTVALAAEGDVAQIGEKSYASLQEAIDAAEEGQIIKLLKNIVVASPMTITSGHKDFTLRPKWQKLVWRR